MGRALTPIDLRVISNVYGEISGAYWFEPSDTKALAHYLLHSYSPGTSEASFKVIAERFAREWFRRGLGRFDALGPQNRILPKLSVISSKRALRCAVSQCVFPFESTMSEKERTPPLEN